MLSIFKNRFVAAADVRGTVNQDGSIRADRIRPR